MYVHVPLGCTSNVPLESTFRIGCRREYDQRQHYVFFECQQHIQIILYGCYCPWIIELDLAVVFVACQINNAIMINCIETISAEKVFRCRCFPATYGACQDKDPVSVFSSFSVDQLNLRSTSVASRQDGRGYEVGLPQLLTIQRDIIGGSAIGALPVPIHFHRRVPFHCSSLFWWIGTDRPVLWNRLHLRLAKKMVSDLSVRRSLLMHYPHIFRKFAPPLLQLRSQLPPIDCIEFQTIAHRPRPSPPRRQSQSHCRARDSIRSVRLVTP